MIWIRYDDLMICFTVIAALLTADATAGGIEFHRDQLANGIKIVIAQVPDAPRQTIFTFLPITMVNDDVGRAQWSHLLEHMVLRSTDPEGLEAGGVQFNGETTHMYLRLETFAEPGQWVSALERHAKWLTARTFDPAVLAREKRNIALEEQGTAANGATTKFALAAWNQVVIHGVKDAAVHGNVADASVEAVQQYASERLGIDESITLATIGPVGVEQVKAELARSLGELAPTAAKPHAQQRPQRDIEAGRIDAAWDLPTRHAMWFWPLPDRKPATIAAATALARTLHMRFAMNSRQTQELTREGQIYPVVDSLRGPIFLIDFCLQSETSIDEMAEMVKQLFDGSKQFVSPAMVGPMIVREIALDADAATIRTFTAPHAQSMAEGFWLLHAMNYEYSWGMPIADVVSRLEALGAAEADPAATEALQKLVTIESSSLLVLEPRPARTDQPAPGGKLPPVRAKPVEP